MVLTATFWEENFLFCTIPHYFLLTHTDSSLSWVWCHGCPGPWNCKTFHPSDHHYLRYFSFIISILRERIWLTQCGSCVCPKANQVGETRPPGLYVSTGPPFQPGLKDTYKELSRGWSWTVSMPTSFSNISTSRQHSLSRGSFVDIKKRIKKKKPMNTIWL